MPSELEQLLAGTSRTFAAAIPLLEAPLRDEVTVAYLLLRIADTFEDAEAWTPEARTQALLSFEESVVSGSSMPLVAPPGFDAAHQTLLAEAPALFRHLASFPGAARTAIVHHVTRTIAGMRAFLGATKPGRGLALATTEDLYKYCYIVAGIVGELLTDLFVEATPSLRRVAAPLQQDAAAFGEALQLVNILKDREGDAAEGRSFLPQTADLREVFARARASCVRAEAYTALLAAGGASGGVLAFTRFPLRVAIETLRALEERGAGAKIGRARVLAILAEEVGS